MRKSLFYAGAAGAMIVSALSAPAALGQVGAQPTSDGSVLLSQWTGPYGGVPPFDKVRIEAFKPALEAAMRQELAEVRAIADNPAPATFDNTIAALERSGQAMTRVSTLYDVWGANLNIGQFPDVQQALAPELARFHDDIAQDPKLFARIDAIYLARDRLGLSPEQKQLVWLHWTLGVKQGAKLEPAAKAKVSAINQRLAALYTQFSQNLLADEAGHVLYLEKDDLAGLPQSVRDAAASAASEHGRAGQWAILNTRSSIDPFLTYSDRRQLREQVWRTFYSRGDNRDLHDNTRAIIPEILRLRAEKARLMGYPTYAHWKLQDEMARTPERAMELMMQVWPSAIARVRQEVADMQAIADQEHAGIRIAAWDYRYYAEKVRKAKYEIDLNQVKPYLQLDHIRDGMFWAAGQLYGFSFTPVAGVPVFDPSMSVYKVQNRAGALVGLWYFDPYARSGKNSGAWMNAYRLQERLSGPVTPIVSNNANFVKPAAGQPVLISWDDAITMFHEFGHALHGLNSNVTYPSLASPNQAQDFIEFPSQLNENYLPTREVLARFAVDVEGRAIPADLVTKLLASRTFNQGFEVTEYLASAIMDMKLHLADPSAVGDPDQFEKTELAKLGMPSEMVMRHRTAQFQHIFSGDDYAAGYYSYLWAQVLDHDAFEAFLEEGGAYNPHTAKRLHDDIMQVGYSVDPAEAFRDFRGRDPEVGAYLRAKGFPVPSITSAASRR